MLAERTKMLNQESRRKAASVQSITDKMNRLTNRKVTIQHKPFMVNEYGGGNNASSGGDKGEKNNHSNIINKNKSSTTIAEGKREFL